MNLPLSRSAIAFATACACAAALGVPASASAARYIPVASYVDPLGGRTSLLGINNAGWLTGSVRYDDGTAKGLVRDAGGAYTTFSVDPFTQGRAISETNTVVGYSQDVSKSGVNQFREFTRGPGGALTILKNPGTGDDLHGIAQGINGSGAIVGDYFTGTPARRHGFILDGASFTDFTVPGASNTRLRGINDAGDIVGFATGLGLAAGFFLSGGAYSLFNAPGGVNGTNLQDLNNFGVAVGQYTDASFNIHAFTYDTHTSLFTELSIAGATTVQAFGINDLGQVILTTDLASGPNNFIYDPRAVPEPATWAMMLLGFGGMGAALRRRRSGQVFA